MKKFTVQSATDLKNFTDITYPQGSFYFNALLRSSDIRVNGVKVSKNVPLKSNDIVTYYTTPKQEACASHLTCYEDDNIYVADKYSGVAVEALSCELNYYPVHRLDRNTAGVLIFAKNRLYEDKIKKLFKEHAVVKKYLCFAKNAFKNPEATLSSYLIKDESKGKVTISDSPKRGYVKIITEYKVLESFGDYALVEVTLHTGKTHQIRAHLAHIGCPVLGDEKYGDEVLNKKYSAKRQCLVSKYVSFELKDKSYRFISSFDPVLPSNR